MSAWGILRHVSHLFVDAAKTVAWKCNNVPLIFTNGVTEVISGGLVARMGDHINEVVLFECGVSPSDGHFSLFCIICVDSMG